MRRLFVSFRVGRGSLIQAGALIISSLIVTVGLISTVAAGRVRQEEQRRTYAQSPVFADIESGATVYLGFGAVDLDGHAMQIVGLAPARNGTASLPPGIDRLPSPGEVFLSPVFAAQCVTRSSCPFAEKIVGTIGREGLIQPRQRLAYVGVARSDIPGGGSWLASFGSQQFRGKARFQVGDAGFAMFLLVPMAGLIAVAMRWGARKSRRRYSTLILLGATPAQATADQTIRATLAAVIGATAGIGSYVIGSHHVHRLWIVNRPLDTRDLKLHILSMVAIAAAVVALVSAVSVTAALAVHRQARMRRRRVGRVAPLLLLAGLAVIASSAATSVRTPGALRMTPLLQAGLALFGLGLTSGLSPIVALVGGWIGRHSGPAIGVAGHRLRDDSFAATRASSPVAITCFIASVTFTVATLYAPESSDFSFTELGSSTLFATWDTTETRLTASVLSDSAESAVDELGLYNNNGIPVGRAIVATCPQLQTLFDSAPEGCNGSIQRLQLVAPTETDAVQNLYLRSSSPSGDLHRLGVAETAAVSINVASNLPFYSSTLVVPPNELPVAIEALTHSRVLGRVASTRDAFFALKAAVIRYDPMADVELPGIGEDSLAGVMRWLLLGAVIASLISLLALVISFLDISDQQQRARGLLEVLGAKRHQVTSAHLAYVALPALINIVVAVFAGVLASLAYVTTTKYLPPIGQFVAIAAIGLAACLIVALATTPRPPQSSELAKVLRAE